MIHAFAHAFNHAVLNALRVDQVLFEKQGYGMMWAQAAGGRFRAGCGAYLISRRACYHGG